MNLVIKDLLINYEIYGFTEKPVLVIVHGWQANLSEWRRIAQALSDDFQVVLIDLPGFGNSGMPQKVWSIYDYADFMKQFFQKLNFKQIVYLGHSFGGRLGVILAVQTNLIKKLILIDSAAIEKKKFSVRTKIFLAKLFKPFLYVIPNFISKKLQKQFQSLDYQQAGELKKIFVKVVNQDLTHLLKKIKIPVLVIWGESDPILNVSLTKVFKKHISNCLVRIVWRAANDPKPVGHFPHMDKPEKFLEIIQEFLSQNE